MIDFSSLPKTSNKRIAVHIKPAAERALRQGNPWVFDQAIRKQSHEGQSGDLAVIFDKKRKFLAIGLYDPDSPIRVKVLQHGQQATIDAQWFCDKLQKAAEIRQQLNQQNTNAYRLVHGENDGLPGLAVDRYVDTLVLKLYTAAWLPHLQAIITGLEQAQPFDRLVLRLSRNIQDAVSAYGLSDGQLLHGDELSESIIFQENGLSFAADVIRGHKTGFFFDQRENRQRVRELSANRRVLDVFAYSGGFSVYAAAGGAESVTSLDVSAPALESAKANMRLNRQQIQGEHHIIVGDAFEELERLRKNGTTFDMLIVDPPSFAKRADEVEGALIAYSRLAELALAITEPDGVFVMASCSSRVSADDFFKTILRTAKSNGREVEEIERTAHALDHPVGFAEGAYLKCLFARV